MKSVYTFADLQSWEKAGAELSPPARLAVFGDPVAHSLSPQLHNPALAAAGIDAQYIRLHIRPEELDPALRLLPRKGFLGANLTIPHKAAALEAMDEVDDLARKIGAVNTVVIDNTDNAEGAKLIGYNSDGPGFLRAIRHEFSVDLRDLRILVLGAGGGAGKAVAVQCALEHCERLVLVNRTAEKAAALAEELRPHFREERLEGPDERLVAVPWEREALEAELENIDLIVNATSLGMKRTDPELLHDSLIRPHHLVYDMVYSPPRTRLIMSSLTAGARVANGLSMLLYQGAISSEHWFNRDAPLSAMRQGLAEAVAAKD